MGTRHRQKSPLSPPAMTHRLNKSFYAALPSPIADHIRAWAARRRCRSVTVHCASRFYIAEDANYTAFSPDCSLTKTAGAAGEWFGPSGLRPGAECPLPRGCSVVEEGRFCGAPYLTLTHNAALALAEVPSRPAIS